MIFAREMPRTSSTLPRKPLPDFLTKGVGCQTFQEEEIVAPFDEHNLPENVFLAGTHPHPFNPSAVRHWSQNACPPRAYSGMKVRGRVNLTLFFITPPRFQRLLEPCAKPEERFYILNLSIFQLHNKVLYNPIHNIFLIQFLNTIYH